MPLPEQELIARRLVNDFEYYAPRCLKIQTKDGVLVPLALNRAQKHMHAKLEEQRERTGKVRALVLKGRQQGASTYIGGRFYWRASGEFGKRVQILTHEIPATDNLFGMVKRYHEHAPNAVKPRTATDSAKELWFDALDTRYAVATAGSKDTGRSGTGQYFHGSEVAFWPNAATHMAGIGQIIPDLAGTEIILESTANGIGNVFHAMVMDALRGKGDYILIFVPWFWEDGYRREPGEDFALEHDEQVYMDTFGLDIRQMAWRRAKIETDFRGDVNLFNQEYPATVDMAFMASSKDSLISPQLVTTARRTKLHDPVGPLILACDPAEYGDDSTAIVWRKGRKVFPVERHHGRGTMEIAGIMAMHIDKRRPAATVIDVTGIGTGVADRLIEQGYQNVHRVHFGSKALDEKTYVNRRAECYGLTKEWFEEGPCELPDDDLLQIDLTSLRYHYDSSRRLVIESKEHAKQRGVASPDSGDALVLTHAVRVSRTVDTKEPTWRDRLRRHQSIRGSAMSA